MSNNFVLVSSDDVNMEEFSEFIKQFGGTMDFARANAGQVSAGERHLWVFLSPGTLREIIEDELEFMTNELGAVPRSCVVVEVSSDPSVDILVIDFCVAFSERWRAIVCDSYDRIFRLADLRRLQREGKGFEPVSAGQG